MRAFRTLRFGIKPHDALNIGLCFERRLHEVGFNALKLQPIERQFHFNACSIFRRQQHHFSSHQIAIMRVITTGLQALQNELTLQKRLFVSRHRAPNFENFSCRFRFTANKLFFNTGRKFHGKRRIVKKVCNSRSRISLVGASDTGFAAGSKKKAFEA